MALEPGAQLGRYRIERLLGAGAMGEVYLAEDPQIGRRLAIKTVRIVAGGGHDVAELQERLVREARAAGRLLHPHIVTLFDAGESEGVFYLAFEFVDGVDLSQRLRGTPPLTVREVLQIARQAAEGLDAAHGQGIVHRDIKPANILLDQQGQVKISDFGIAKMVGQTELTQTGSVVGSPHYLSPEQVRGEPLDGRSDLFSLGVVVYEMLTRLRPFEGETITTLVYQILSTEPQPLSESRPELPPNLARVVTRLLHKDPAHRYASGGEFAQALAECERELPSDLLNSPAAGTAAQVAARRAAAASGSRGSGATPIPTPPPAPPSAATPPPPPPPPSPPAVEMDTAATSLLSSRETAQIGSTPPPTPAPAVPASSSNAPRVLFLLAALLVLALVAVGGFFAWRSFVQPPKPDLTAQTESDADEPPTANASAPAETAAPSEEPDAAEWRELDPAEDGPGGVESATGALSATRPLEDPGADRGESASQTESEAGPENTVESPDRSGPIEPRQPPIEDRSPTATHQPRNEAEPRDDQVPSRSEVPEVAEPEPEVVPEPEPEPEIEVLPVEQTLQTTLSLRFDVTPSDTFVLIKEVTERRFISIGRAEEWSGKKDARVYDLPGPGEYYVRFRRQGHREVTYRVVAEHGAGATPVVLRMR